jgi:hypothetical protein
MISGTIDVAAKFIAVAMVPVPASTGMPEMRCCAFDLYSWASAGGPTFGSRGGDWIGHGAGMPTAWVGMAGDGESVYARLQGTP